MRYRLTRRQYDNLLALVEEEKAAANRKVVYITAILDQYEAKAAGSYEVGIDDDGCFITFSDGLPEGPNGARLPGPASDGGDLERSGQHDDSGSD